MDTKYLISKRVHQSKCFKCKRVVLEGLDTGIPYRLDPIPLTVYGELVALMGRRRSYRLLPGALFSVREAVQMKSEQWIGRPLVLADHLCIPAGQRVDSRVIESRHINTITQLLTGVDNADSDAVKHHDALMYLSIELGARVTEQNEPPF